LEYSSKEQGEANNTIALRNVTLVENPNNLRLRFHLVGKERTWRFDCSSVSDARSWIDALNKVMCS